MRGVVSCIIFFFALGIQHLSASHKKLTDAELGGFHGAVKSVTTNVRMLEHHPDVSDHPIIVYPIWCQVCEFDQAGSLVRFGQNSETKFVGQTTHYVRDETGAIREQISENENGQPFQRLVLGPFGKTEEWDYRNGVLEDRQTFRYDQDGNLIEWLTFDASGNQTASTTATFDEQGNVTEQFDRGPNGSFRLHFTQSYDPESDTQIFTNYNEDGTVRVTFIAKKERVTSYWQQPSDKHEYGSGVCFKTAPKERRCESRNPGGKVWRTVETFRDERRHDQIRVELQDETGMLQMAADYEYDTDAHGNWTKRSVWVWRTDTSERKLHEIDTRTLTYWK